MAFQYATVNSGGMSTHYHARSLILYCSAVQCPFMQARWLPAGLIVQKTRSDSAGTGACTSPKEQKTIIIRISKAARVNSSYFSNSSEVLTILSAIGTPNGHLVSQALQPIHSEAWCSSNS